MTEEIDFIIDTAKEHMDGSIAHLEKEFLNIRAGKATPQMLGGVFVDYYGSQTPLSQVANINVPDARTITVTPWEKSMLHPIEKAIMIANIGFNPMNNGDVIIISVPPLTEERRRDLAKQAKSEADAARFNVRLVREDRLALLDGARAKMQEKEELVKSSEIEIQTRNQIYAKEKELLQSLKDCQSCS